MFGNTQSHKTRRGLVSRLEAIHMIRQLSKTGLSSFVCVEILALYVDRSTLRAYSFHACRYCLELRQSYNTLSDRICGSTQWDLRSDGPRLVNCTMSSGFLIYHPLVGLPAIRYIYFTGRATLWGLS